MANISLYTHQREALRQMHNGCILCGKVGCGKSRTALAYYYVQNGGDLDAPEYTPMRDPPKDIYIITTARKRDTHEWEGELAPFLLAVDSGVSLYANKVVIDSWNNIKKYADVKDAFFIFDEQRVVGSGAWVKAFLKIAKANEWILLSATPGDTWSDYIPVFIANGFYKNRSEFTREHIVYSAFTKFPKIDRYLNTGRLIRLRDRVLVNVHYKREEIVGHGVERHAEYISCAYDRAQYQEIVKTRWNPFTDAPIQNASEFCYVLRRVVNSSEARQLAAAELVEQHPKSIIFYNFDYELEILKSLFTSPEIEAAEWNGHRHQPIPEGDAWVFLVQYNAGAEGWNCIRTDAVIFYSQNYSYRTMEQAAGRIDRLNTPYRDLYYYHLCSSAGIDRAIRDALRKKRNFNEGKFYQSK